MKSNELRIGNQIKYHEKIITVAGIVRNTIYYESKELCFDGNIGDYKPFKPIQLTEEWLLKFGFKETFMGTYSVWDFEDFGRSFEVTQDSNGFTFQIHGDFLEIKYVHELQNLYFTLTGEELAIS